MIEIKLNMDYINRLNDLKNIYQNRFPDSELTYQDLVRLMIIDKCIDERIAL